MLTYPFLDSTVEAVMRHTAEEMNAELVNIRERFDRELRSRPRSDLFVEDGHCNDAGYTTLAETVADAIMVHLPPPPADDAEGDTIQISTR